VCVRERERGREGGGLSHSLKMDEEDCDDVELLSVEA